MTAEQTKRIEQLLTDEIDLRTHAERVAQKRRELGPGPIVEGDYTFTDENGKRVALKDLFSPGKDQLLMYHFMYAPKDDDACPMCTMWSDGYDAIAPHVNDVADFVLVAKAPIEKFNAWAKGRGWHNIRRVSSYGSTFNRDFDAEDDQENQNPGLSVFTRDPDGRIRHFYTKHAELTDNVNRGIDLFTPVWNLLDMLPSGRGDWLPKYKY